MAHVRTAPKDLDDVLTCMERILDLCNKYNLILQAEETLSTGKSLSKEVQEVLVLCSKSSVGHQLDLLREFLKGNPVQFDTDFPIKEVDPAASCVERGRLRVVEDQLNTLVSKARGLPDVEFAPVQANDSAGLSKEGRETKEVDETLPLDKPRYLYVSDGLVICCLDLQQSKCQPHEYKDADSVEGLPKVSILRMLDKGDPISAGLYKSGSDVYIIGGQVLPPGYPNAQDLKMWGTKPWGADLYLYLMRRHKLNGSSCSIHRLSGAGNTLSLSESGGIPELQEPKVWPIVEKINGQIHVIDSLPLKIPFRNTRHTFTHEFLTLDEAAKGWTQVSTGNLPIMDMISSHLVVANRIYAATDSKKVWIYDSEANEWISRRPREDFHPFCIKHVWDFIHYGTGRCAMEFLHLFVVIAIVQDVAAVPRDCSAQAVAYLVTSCGRVICFQRLPHFYEERLQPRFFNAATVVHVDELGRAMCAIVQGRTPCDFDENGDYLFINTFHVEVLSHAWNKAGEIRERMSEYSCAVEMEFVGVVVEDRYMYKMDQESESEGERCDIAEFPFLQACFP